jgi:2-oxoglutarate ferredoxin oxidoreductase subunit beta
MPSAATGALVANSSLLGIGVSGDGDTASIGIGQFVHLVRRNLPLVYIIEDNGVYGLTKGQFSATADLGAKQKGGAVNEFLPIDCCSLAIELGGTFVARSFSGDMKQLQTILEAAIAHKGTSVIDVISPCVTFNDHAGSTKSYLHTRKHKLEVVQTDFVPKEAEISADYAPGTSALVTMHDGSIVKFVKVAEDYDPKDRLAVQAYLQEHQAKGEIPTGLLYLDENTNDMHETSNTVLTPLSELPFEQLCPGSAALEQFQRAYR